MCDDPGTLGAGARLQMDQLGWGSTTLHFAGLWFSAMASVAKVSFLDKG